METDSLDEPDLRVGGFRLWVRGRQFPDAADYWDGNWLDARASMEESGAQVETSGPFIRIDELVSFSKELRRLVASLSATAELRCLEPDLHLLLHGDGLGHIAVTVDITPDQQSQSHSFSFDLDQTFLTPLIAACENIVERFPIRGSSSD